VGTPLKDWDININFGIKTGLNNAFIITGEKKDVLIAEDPKSAEIIRPILRGRDIKRYNYEFADLWLINTHNGLKEKNIKPINIEDYPAIKKHLDNYYPELEKRTDKGATPYNLRNCAYMEDFYRQKIVWGEISDKTKFSIEMGGEFIAEATTFLMTGNNLVYLLGILNSRLSEYIFSKIGTTTGVGTVRWKKFTIEQLYVPTPNIERIKEYEDVVTEIINLIKINQNYEEFEQKINNMIYQDFDLSDDEIKFMCKFRKQIL